MLKSIAWFIVLGIVVLTIEAFAIVMYVVFCRYKGDFGKAHKWVDVFTEIHDDPWIRLGKSAGWSARATDIIETVVHIVTWPYSVCVAMYSTVLSIREFERRLKEES